MAALLEAENFSPEMANFAARASQGHIGRARYLAKSEDARNRREAILKLSLQITDIASAFKAAATLVDAAKKEAEEEAELRDDAELKSLKEAWGQRKLIMPISRLPRLVLLAPAIQFAWM